ncbi:Hsp20/alpha crystallin family protein [Virgibacillus necropolis]|uniref:Heat-shock protein n=1 Tax=Virgibacillus necropolis TaxID=163877 RepID=A0A221MEM7_9BACI|nr:Hsp20/alpha crystallin family protein [Virgibacillus necropolis]ASN06050.1 heat-shock protein [Virgibacillus necropolis]
MGSSKDNLSKWFHKDSFYDLAKHMDSFFNESFKQFFNQKPFEINMQETKSDVVIRAMLPGYNRDQIRLAIIGNQLRITVEDSKFQEKKKEHFTNTNKEYKMERMISLPFTISEEDTKATYNDGILKISTPKKKPNTRFINIDQIND